MHPLVRAAIADARAWPGGSVELLLPPDAAPELAALAGKAGVLRVALVDYAGFEPVQRLVAAAVVDGAPDRSVAGRPDRCVCGRSTAESVNVASGPAMALDDAMDEAVFVDQREVEKREQKHFEQAIGQLERFVDDKVLVCRRERASIAEKLRSARSSTRRGGRLHRARPGRSGDLRLADRDERLERRISALESREDEVYRKWRNEYHELRYRAPTVTRLFQVTFRIARRIRRRRAEAAAHGRLAPGTAVSVVSGGGAEEAVARADGCDRRDSRRRAGGTR